MRRTKKVTQIIMAIAKQLPRQRYESRSAIILTGKELIDSGQKEVEKKPVDPEEKYIQYIPLIKDCNHSRRMKRAFDNNGFEGVKNYILPYLKAETREKAIESLKAHLC